MYKKNKWVCILLAAPFVIFVVTFLLYPAIVNIINSFYKFQHKLDNNPVWVGLDNWVWIFKQKEFLSSLRNTAILAIFVIIFQIGIALLLALLVNSLKKRVGFFRIVFFMPIVVSGTAIGLLYQLLIQPTGLFTQIIGKDNFNWLPSNSFLALLVIMAPMVWQYVGFYFVIFLTGLAGLSEDVYEAAKIDGANSMRMTFSITLPMLQNVIRTCVVLAITGSLKAFDLAHIIAPDGDPGRQNLFLGAYNNYLYTRNYIGQSSAFSIFIVVLGVIVAWTSNKLLKENKDL